MNIAWTNPGSEGLTKIRAEDQTLYDNPPVASGVTVDLANYILNSGGNNNMNEVDFNSNMEGKTFTMNFIMGDGSAKSYTFTPEN